jgi:hypothetical protein
MLALARKQPPPAPRSAQVLERAGYLRSVLTSWRAHHGIADDPRLAEAARISARHVALLTYSWRLSMILNSKAGPYPATIQMLPRHLLAASHMLELGHLARRITPGLRAATETFQGAAPLIGLLALFPQRAHLKAPLDAGIAQDVKPALEALSRTMMQSGRTLGGSVQAALADFPVHLRSMALTAMAFSDA